MSKLCLSPPPPLQNILWFAPIFEIFNQSILIDFSHFWNISSKNSHIESEQIVPLSSTATTSLPKYIRSAHLFCNKQGNSNYRRKLCDVKMSFVNSQMGILSYYTETLILLLQNISNSNDGSVAKNWGSKVFLDLYSWYQCQYMGKTIGSFLHLFIILLHTISYHTITQNLKDQNISESQANAHCTMHFMTLCPIQ